MIHVENVVPVVLTGGDGSAVAGEPFVRVGWFLDPGQETWSSTGRLRRRREPAIAAPRLGQGLGDSPVFAKAGTYVVTVSVSNSHGPGRGTFQVTVPLPRPYGPHLCRPLAGDPAQLRSPRCSSASASRWIQVRASALSAYRLVLPGRDRRFGTKDDQIVPSGPRRSLRIMRWCSWFQNAP